jgi:archaeoflavoprotein AfpA
MDKFMNKRFAWAVTGAGDLLLESLEVIKKIISIYDVEVTAILSKSGDVVLKWYRLREDLDKVVHEVGLEKGPNSPFYAGPLQIGHYDFFFVSPATGNTVAKIALGLADSLVSNCVSQAMKGGTPVLIYPVDQKPGNIVTYGPKGEEIVLRTREVDLENAEKLRRMQGITVLEHPYRIEDYCANLYR